MANIKATGKGSFRIRVSAGFDGNGKRKFYTETYTPSAKTSRAIEREVSHYAEVLEQRVHDGLISISDGTTFTSFVDTWAKDWAADHLTISQQESYLDSLKIHVIPTIGNQKIAKIKKRDCVGIVSALKNKGLAPKSIRRIVTAMRSVFKYALYLEIINSDPCDGLILPPLQKDDGIHCFDEIQTQAFLNALEMKYPNHAGRRTDLNNNNLCTKYVQIPYQFRLYFNFAIKTGLRRGEMIGLQWSDIDFEKQTVSVSRAVSHSKQFGQIVGKPKTPSAVRTVPIPSDCVDMLCVWFEQQKEYSHLSTWQGKPTTHLQENPIFIQSNGLRMDLDSPKRAFKSVIDKYNKLVDSLPPEEAKKHVKLPVIRLHDLRHCYATLLIANGMDIVSVSRLMGHASPSVTMDVYSHLLESHAREAAKVFERLFSTPTSTIQPTLRS